MPSRRNRRQFLLAATGTLTALAGCSAIDSQQRSGPSPARLGNIDLINEHRSAHEMSVLVRRDEEIIFWETFELEAFEGNEALKAEIPVTEFGCTTGRYRLDVALDSGERLSVDPNERSGSGSVDGNDYIIGISERGTLEAFVMDDGPNRCATTTSSESDEGK